MAPKKKLIDVLQEQRVEEEKKLSEDGQLGDALATSLTKNPSKTKRELASDAPAETLAEPAKTPEKLKEEVEAMTDEQLAENTTIIGDSIGVGLSVWGMGRISSRHKRFAIGSAPLTGKKFVNKSTGETVYSVRDQLDNVAPKRCPFLVVQGGTNQLDSIKDKESAERIAQKQIDIALEASKRGFKKIIMVTIPPHKEDTMFGRNSELYNQALKELYAEKKDEFIKAGIDLFDLRGALMSSPDWGKYKYLSDEVHPTTRGAKEAAALILARVKDSPITQQESWAAAEKFGQEISAEDIELEKNNPALTLQKDLIEEFKKLKEKTPDKKFEEIKSDIEGKYKTMSVEDIRFGKFFEDNEAITDDNERIKNVQDETLSRLLAYTKCTEAMLEGDYKDKWFTLDYQKIGGSEHEFGVGLGDILLDPSIKTILVKRGNKIIKAHRGTVPPGRPHEGRVGFLDENDNYVPTFTGDQFRICSDTLDLSDEKIKKEYLNRLKTETNTRKKSKETYRAATDGVDLNLIDYNEIFNRDQQSALYVDLSKSGEVVSQMRYAGLSPSQIASAKIIEAKFKEAGLSNNIIAASIANAYAESALNAGIVGDGGNSIGLFQLNIRGLGAGMSVADRQDPVKNCAKIIETIRGSSGQALLAADKNGASASELASIFCRDIERPANKELRMKERAYIVYRFFRTNTLADSAQVPS